MTGFYMKCNSGLKWLKLKVKALHKHANFEANIKEIKTEALERCTQHPLGSRCSRKKAFIKTLQDLQENICDGTFSSANVYF